MLYRYNELLLLYSCTTHALLLYQVAQVRGNPVDSAQLLADSTALVAVRKADTEQTLAESSTDLLEQHSILRMPVSEQDYDRAQALFVNTPETAGLGSAPSCVIWDTNAQDWTFAGIRRSIGLNSLHRMCISNMLALSPALSSAAASQESDAFTILSATPPLFKASSP